MPSGLMDTSDHISPSLDDVLHMAIHLDRALVLWRMLRGYLHIIWRMLCLMRTWHFCWDVLAPIGDDMAPWWWDIAPFHDDMEPIDEMSHLLGDDMSLWDETFHLLEGTFHFWNPYTWFLSESSTLWGHTCHTCEIDHWTCIYGGCLILWSYLLHFGAIVGGLSDLSTLVSWIFYVLFLYL